jgi:hypothetical protein
VVIESVGKLFGVQFFNERPKAQGFSVVIKDAREEEERQAELLRIGEIELFDQVDGETLHKLGHAHNSRIMEALFAYRDLVAREPLDERRMFEQRLKRSGLPKLDEEIANHAPWSRFIYREIYQEFLGENREPIGLRLDEHSAVLSRFIPPIDLYLENYAKKTSRGMEADYDETPKEFSRDYDGWKAFLRAYKNHLPDFFFKPITAYVPFSHFNRHAYIVGGSGSGKTELLKLIAHNILTNKKTAQNLVVIDPHGDLADQLAHFEGVKTILLDPFLFNDKMPAFNPFYLMPSLRENEAHIEATAYHLTSAFEEIIADASISAQMRTLLMPCLCVLLRRGDSNFIDLQRFMLSSENADLVELGKEAPNQAHAQFFQSMFNDKSYEPTKRSIYTRIQSLLNSNAFRRITSGRDGVIDFNVTLNSPRNFVVVKLPKGSLGAEVSSALGRFIIAQIKTIGLIRERVPEANRIPTYCLIDECQNYIGESIETALTELRKFGIHFILANQIVGQDMSTQLRKIIFANTGVKFAGFLDETSRQSIAREFGANDEAMQSLTTGKFLCKISDPKTSTKSFVFKAPSYLIGRKNSCSKVEWEDRKKFFANFYTPISELDGATPKASNSQLQNSDAQAPDYLDTENRAPAKKRPKFNI